MNAPMIGIGSATRRNPVTRSIAVAALVGAALALPISGQADSLRKLFETKEEMISKLAIVPLFFDVRETGPDPHNRFPSSAFVTVATDTQSRLRLRLWTVDSAGKAHPDAVFTTEGTVKEVAAVETQHCGSEAIGCFVTAVRDSEDDLRLIQWFVEPGASFIRGGTAVEDDYKITELAASSIAGQWAFIAARDFDGNLRLSRYAVGGTDSPVVAQLPGGSTSDRGSKISATPAHDQTVAMRDTDGELRVRQFRFEDGSHTTRSVGTGTGGEISEVRIADDRTGSPSVGELFTFSTTDGPTGVRIGAGCSHRLLVEHGHGKIIGWRALGENQHGELQRTREKQLTDFGGIAKEVDLLFLRGGQNRLVAAHLGFENFCRLLERDRGKPRLTLFVWDTGSRSDEFIRVAEAHLGGDYTHIAMTEIAPSDNQRRFVVALRGVRGELKVTVWGFTRS
jgi:hypothetical protein